MFPVVLALQTRFNPRRRIICRAYLDPRASRDRFGPSENAGYDRRMTLIICISPAYHTRLCNVTFTVWPY